MNRSAVVSVLLTWASQWGLWLIFTNNAGAREMLAGAAGAAIATLFVFLLLSKTRERFRFHLGDLAQAVHVPEILLSGSWILIRALVRRALQKPIPAGIVAVRFRPGGAGAYSRGRRALAITFLTFAPNNLVFGILEDQKLLFFHTVIPQPLPRFMMKMGAYLEDGQ